jgi:hypothetical protein
MAESSKKASQIETIRAEMLGVFQILAVLKLGKRRIDSQQQAPDGSPILNGVL